MTFTPNGRPVRLRSARICSRTTDAGMPPMPNTPQPPASLTAAASAGPAMPPPIPTEKIG